MRTCLVMLMVLLGGMASLRAQDEAAFEETVSALTLYQPPENSQAVIRTLMAEAGAWLSAGNDPATLQQTLNDATDNLADGLFTVTLRDLTNDEADDILIQPEMMGLPLIVLASNGDQYLLPPYNVYDFDWYTWLPRPTNDLRGTVIEDFTGDDLPELLVTYRMPSASGSSLVPTLYQWRDGHFEIIFAARLVNQATPTSLVHEPIEDGTQQIILNYPFLYENGFEARFINHPLAQQFWQWDAAAGRYAQVNALVEPVSAAPNVRTTVEDQLRWMTNTGEEAFRAGDYPAALAQFNAVLTMASLESWSPAVDQPDWRGVAAFRRAMILLLLNRSDDSPPANYPADGFAAMQEIVSTYQGDKLGELALAFIEGYGDGLGDAVACGIGAMQRVNLYAYFYMGGEIDSALQFPLNATLLHPIGGIAVYLNRHPERADDPPALQNQLVEMGYPVVGVVKLNAGLQIQFDPETAPIAAVPWLLTQVDGAWQVTRSGSVAPQTEWPEVGGF